MTSRRDTVRNVALASVLLLALVPWNPGAVYSASGEQLTFGVPLPTVALLVGLLVTFVVSSTRPFPWLPLPVLIGVVALSGGVLGSSWAQFPTTLKELIQLGEMTFVAVYLAQFGTRRQVRTALVWIMAGVEFGLLLLAATGGLRWLELSPAKWAAFVILAAPFAVLAMGRRCPWFTAVVPGAVAGLTFSHAGPLIVWCAVVVLSGLAYGRRHWPALLAVPFAIAVSLLPGRSEAWDRLRPHYDQAHLKRSVIEADLALRSPSRLPLGAGLGQYKAAINRLRSYGSAEPHPADTKVPRDGNCQYLVTLVESGPLGLAGLLFLLVAACAAAWRPVPGDPPQEVQDRRAVAMALVAVLGASVFALTLSRGIGIWLGILLGLAFEPRYRPLSRRRLATVAVGWGAVAGLLLLSLLVNGRARESGTFSHANRVVAGIWGGAVGAPGPRIVVLPDACAGPAVGVVTVEAETAFEVMAPFVVVRTDGASGNAALAVPEGRGKGIGRATLRLAVPTAGHYLLFAQVQWSDGCGNSMAFRIGGQDIRLADEVYGRWHQITGAVVLDLPAGDLQVQLVNLEDGVMLDLVGLRAVAGE